MNTETGFLWKGRPVEEYSKEELIQALQQTYNALSIIQDADVRSGEVWAYGSWLPGGKQQLFRTEQKQREL